MRLSEPATVRISFERAARGRRSKGRCRRATPKLRKAKRCLRYVKIKNAVLIRKGLAAGLRKIKFSGRIGRRALKPGRYRAAITATDARGNRSKAARPRFRVVRVAKRRLG